MWTFSPICFSCSSDLVHLGPRAPGGSSTILNRGGAPGGGGGCATVASSCIEPLRISFAFSPSATSLQPIDFVAPPFPTTPEEEKGGATLPQLSTKKTSTLWRHHFPPAVVEPQLQDWVAWRHHPWCLFDDSRHLVAQAKVMGGPCLPCRLRARRCARVGQGGDRGRSQPAPTRSARAGDAPRMATHHCARDRCACVTPRSSRLARLSQAVACKGSTPGWTGPHAQAAVSTPDPSAGRAARAAGMACTDSVGRQIARALRQTARVTPARAPR